MTAQRKFKPYELEMRLADMVEAGIDAGLKHEFAKLRDELDAIWKELRKLQKMSSGDDSRAA